MYLESIRFVASVVKASAQFSGKTITETTEQIGEEGLARLIHNAPMDRWLRFDSVVIRVLRTFGIRYEKSTIDILNIKPDLDYGSYIGALVSTQTKKRNEYPEVLFAVLTEKRLY